jgi:tetratricopeptide (TPR) repeat protein
VATETLSLINLNGAHRNRFVDELLDTLGMIYQAQGKTSDAIASYESCLKLNPRRIQTREHLIVLYRRIGNEGVANAHEEAIQSIKKENAEK